MKAPSNNKIEICTSASLRGARPGPPKGSGELAEGRAGAAARLSPRNFPLGKFLRGGEQLRGWGGGGGGVAGRGPAAHTGPRRNSRESKYGLETFVV